LLLVAPAPVKRYRIVTSFWNTFMIAHPAALDRLKTRIQGLRSKTTDNGCTEAEALLAAGKVAELLDRYDLSLTDVEITRCGV
jgi:hypothetical protein